MGERLVSGVSGVQMMSSLLDTTRLSTSFASTDPETSETSTNSLASMLRQVAKVIKTRDQRQVKAWLLPTSYSPLLPAS